MPTQPVVAVVNTNPDLVELLKVHIEKAGFVVLVIHIHDIRLGLDIGAVLAQHDPQVIVYDVAPIRTPLCRLSGKPHAPGRRREARPS